MITSQATRGFFRVLLSALFVVNLGACSWVKGLWDGDVAHDAGKARVVYANGDRYEGGVRQGLRHGAGM